MKTTCPFTVACPVFQSADDVHYQFMLEGFDRDWVDNGNSRFIQYTNLSGGKYKLRYRAGRDNNLWEEGYTSPVIRIITPFWRTEMFLTAAILFVFAIFYVIYRLRIVRIRREEALKTEFNKRLADQEMAALRAQMNPHFMFQLFELYQDVYSQRKNERSKHLSDKILTTDALSAP